MKKILLTLFALISFNVTLFAAVQYDLADFLDQGSTSAGLGLISVDNRPFSKMSLSPNYNFKGLSLGFDLNIYIPMDGNSDIPDGLEWIVFRKVGYNHKGKYGFEWGHLKNLRFGYGLIMDDYDTGSGGGTSFSQNKTGFYGFGTYQNVKLKTLYTYLNTQALRLETTLSSLKLFNTPIIVGGTYVTDTDGVNDSITGAQRDSQTAYGVDIGVPISDLFTLYSEVAQIQNHGKGLSTGFLGDFNNISYRAEYRYLTSDFVPGYFNNSYEATSFDFSSDSLQEDLSGILVAARTEQLNGDVLAGVQYEYYKDINRITAGIGWKNLTPVTGVINYSKEFSASDNTLGTAVMDFYYETGKWYDIVGQYKWVFLPNNESETYYSIGIQVVPGEIISMPDFLK